MLLYHFYNFEFSHSFVFKDIPSRPASIGGVFDLPVSVPPEVKSEVKKVEKSDDASVTPPEIQAPIARPEVIKKEKRLEQIGKKARAERGQLAIERRLDRKEILTDEERPKYVLKIKEAIEKLGPDRWYEFVSAKEHQHYNGDYKKWNADFCNLLLDAGQTTAEEIKDPVIQRKYTAGLQCFLVDQFASASITFELGSGNRVNKFTYVDGYLGGYTMSALGAYLKSPLYAPASKVDKTKWDSALLESELGSKFKTPGRQKEFSTALTHLTDQFREADFSKVGQSTVDASQVEPVGPNPNSDQDNPTEIATQGEKNIKLEDFPEKQRGGFEQLAERAKSLADKRAMNSMGLELLSERISELNEELDSFKKDSTEALGPNPDTEVDIDIIDDDYMRPNAWPRKAYDEWVRLYKQLEVMDSRFTDPDQVEAKKTAVLQAFKDYKDALKEYFDKEKEIASELKEKLKQNIFREFSKYDFPSDIDVKMFCKNGNISPPFGFASVLKSKVPNRLFPVQLVGAKERLNTYFDEIPTKPFKPGDTETFRTSIKTDKVQELSQAFARYEKYYSKLDPIEVFNSLIYLNNAQQFAEGLSAQVDDYNGDYQLALREMDKEPYNQMLARIRKAEPDAVASVN